MSNWYVRPAGGSYGDEDGTSYADAWDGLNNVVWGTGGVIAGDTLYICGFHLHNMTTFSTSYCRLYPPTGTDESHRVTIRGDYPGDPGIVWGAYLMNYDSWASEGSNVYSIVLPADHGDEDYYFEDITSSSWTVLAKKASLAECQSTAGSYYSPDYKNGSKLYVHCSDNGLPTGRISLPWFGWSCNCRNVAYHTYLNLKYYAHGWLGNAVDYSHHMKWDGCTSWYGKYAMITLYDNCNYFDVRNCDIGWAGNGIYNISNTDNGAPDNYIFKDNYIHDVGITNFNRNNDEHGIGIQGGHDGLIEGNHLQRCGNSILLYAFTDQELRNTIVRYNWVEDAHLPQDASESIGISTQCNTDSLSDKSGNQFYYNIVVGNPGPGFRFQFEDEQLAYNNVAINCDRSFVSERSSGTIGPHIKARNNISYNPTHYHVEYDSSDADTECDYDYNIYYPIGTNTFVHNSQEKTFAQWKSEMSCDSHSLESNPLFVNGSGVFDYDTDVKIQPDSPAKDAGTGVGLTEDYFDNSVPYNLIPDIGIHEYSGEGLSISAGAGSYLIVGPNLSLEKTGVSPKIQLKHMAIRQ